MATAEEKAVARPKLEMSGWRDTLRFFAVALPFRLFFIVLMRYPEKGGDMDYYTLVARNIFYHHAHSGSLEPGPFLPNWYRAPMYPAFRAGMMYLVGESIVPVQIVQCILSAITAWLLWQGARRFEPRMDLLARWGMALCPFEAVFAPSLMSEVLVTFFLTAGITLPWIMRSPKRWVIAGAAFGLGALTRDIYMLMTIGMATFAVLFKVFSDESIKKRWRGPVTLLFTTLLVISPWTARNYSASGKFIPISRGPYAAALWFGTWAINYDHVDNDLTGAHLAVPDYAFKLPGEREKFDRWKREEDDEVTRDKVFLQMFKDRFKAEPAHVLYVWARRAPANWIGSSRFDLTPFRSKALARGTIASVPVKGSLFMLNVFVCGAGWLGVLIAIFQRRWKLMWFALPLLYQLFVYLPTNGMEPRYSQPVFPCVMFLACWVLQTERARWIIARVRSWFPRRTQEAAAE